MWNLTSNNTWAIVFNNNLAFITVRSMNLHVDIRKNIDFFAGIKTIVNPFFDTCNKSPCRIAKTENMLVSFKKLSNRDFLLFFS